MKREITNMIRNFMDNWLPPIIRDNKYFMKPFYYYWFKGNTGDALMNFKKHVYSMSEEEYSSIYINLDWRAKDRVTDMNAASIEYIIKHLNKDATSLLDVGCGRGYFLNLVAEKTSLKLTGTDLFDHIEGLKATYVKAYVEKLPFADKSFDIVTCTHTIEHVLHLKLAIDELKRVACKQLIIVTPRQRFYYYTLDHHVHFFPIKELLIKEIGLTDFECVNIKGDWVYSGNIS